MRNPASVVDPLDAIRDAPHRFTFFAATRRIEETRTDLPRIGEAASPAQEAVHFGQFPELGFPVSDLHSVWQHEAAQVPVLRVQFVGLLGPQGALPLHITEYARERWLHDKDRTTVSFINLLQHRWYSLFYRSWANAQAVVGLHRPELSNTARMLSALAGQEPRPMDTPRVRFAGFFQNHRRSAEGLAAVAHGLLGIAPQIQEFSGQWLPVPRAQRSRLGSAMGRASSGNGLGSGAVLGQRVWDIQSRIELVFPVSSSGQLERFNPLRADLRPFRRAVDDYLNGQLDWGVRLRIPRGLAEPARLGHRVQLGWNGWLGQRRAQQGSQEVSLRVNRGVSRFE